MINNKKKIPVFIINLLQDIEKKEHIKNLCTAYNLSPEFIKAVNGKSLSNKEIENAYSKENAINIFGRELSRGEIGCALSHKKIYQKMVNKRINEALILEDDVEFNSELLNVINTINSFPEKWNLILLGHHSCKKRDLETRYSFWGKTRLTENYVLTRPVECGCGTYGYILTLEAAKIILTNIEKLCQPIDYYTGKNKSLDLYTISPPPIKIHHFLSDNYNSMNERKKLQNNLNLIKKVSTQRHILNFLHLYKIADNIRNIILSLRIPRKYN